MEKPRYTTSKKMIWVSLIASWGLIYFLVGGMVVKSPDMLMSFASLLVPLTFAFITSLVVAHRGFGSLDMRTALKHARDPAAPFVDDAPNGGGSP